MGDLDFYIKQLEAENEKLKASLESALLTNEIEQKRNIFSYERWICNKDGTILQSDYTLDKGECRRWIDFIHTDMIGKDTSLIVSMLCYAYKKDKNAMTARIVWDIDFRTCKAKGNQAFSIYKLSRGRVYCTGEEYKTITDKSIKRKKYGE